MKANLDKLKKFIDTTEPKYETIIILVSLVCSALGYDLKLDMFMTVSGSICLMEIGWCTGWLIFSIIYAILKKKHDRQIESKK